MPVVLSGVCSPLDESRIIDCEGDGKQTVAIVKPSMKRMKIAIWERKRIDEGDNGSYLQMRNVI